MRDLSIHLSELERLRQSSGAQRRGYDLQALIASIFASEHFSVERKSGAGGGRQVDVFATRHESSYLIETKWRKDPANIADVDDLLIRLQSTPPGVVGLLVSHEGFTSEALARIAANSNRPIIVLTGNELESALRRGDFLALLKRKENALRVHGEVLVNDETAKRRRKPKQAASGTFPAPASEFMLPDGRRVPIMKCDGEFGRFTFATELFDIDWSSTSDHGVILDIHLSPGHQIDLIGLLQCMSERNWVTPNGCWSIQQAHTNWHGFGAQALVDALGDWKNRYVGLDVHHTEEFCYYDECDEGFYTLIGAISADSRRWVWQAELSFQLVGIPLDTSSFRELASRLGVHDPLYFRPRDEKSVTRGQPMRTEPVLEPVAYVIDRSRGTDDDEWVSGVVVKNPYLSDDRSECPEWVPAMLQRSEYLVCRLRSWHHRAQPRPSYELWSFESAWTSDALVVAAVADWPD